MPTDRQRRQAAIRKAQRQLARRQEQEARRHRRYQILAVAGTLVVVAGVILGIVFGTSGGNNTTAAGPTASGTATPSGTKATSPAKPTKSASPKPTGSPFPTHSFPKRTHKPLISTGPCRYTETKELLADTNSRDVGLPPDPSPTPTTGTAKLELTTSQGPIEIALDRAAAPCAVQSTIFLARKGFYDNTACPRVVTSGIYVVQCGDPSNTQKGGPTYRFSEEINARTKYDAGAVAMANTGAANSTGSQFFMVYKDSNQNPATGTGLARNYSMIGTITKGLGVLKKVAQVGPAAPPSPTATATSTAAPTDGKPILGLTIEKVTVKQ